MKRYDYIAAEMFGYSYSHYQDKIDIGNRRFYQIMPNEVRLLEKAINESWPTERLADKLEVDASRVSELKEAFYNACKIVDQPSPEAAFEAGIRNTVENTLSELSIDSNTKELLIEQLMYRGKDYKYLLEKEFKDLYVEDPFF